MSLRRRGDDFTRTKVAVPDYGDEASVEIEDVSSSDSKLLSEFEESQANGTQRGSGPRVCDPMSPVLRKRKQDSTDPIKSKRLRSITEIDIEDESSQSNCEERTKVVIETTDSEDSMQCGRRVASRNDDCILIQTPETRARCASRRPLSYKTWQLVTDDDSLNISSATSTSASVLGDQCERTLLCQLDRSKSPSVSVSEGEVDEADEPGRFERLPESPSVFLEDASESGEELGSPDRRNRTWRKVGKQVQSSSQPFEIEESDEDSQHPPLLPVCIDDENASSGWPRGGVSGNELPPFSHTSSALALFATASSSVTRSPHKRSVRCVRDGLVERLQRAALRERSETSVWCVRVLNLLSELRAFADGLSRAAHGEKDEQLMLLATRLSTALPQEVLLRIVRAPSALHGTTLSTFVCEVLHDFRKTDTQLERNSVDTGGLCYLLLNEEAMRAARLNEAAVGCTMLVRADWKPLCLTSAECKLFGLSVRTSDACASGHVTIYTDIRCVKCVD